MAFELDMKKVHIQERGTNMVVDDPPERMKTYARIAWARHAYRKRIEFPYKGKAYWFENPSQLVD